MTEISTDLVRRLIAAQFPQWAGLEIAPLEPQGWDNRSFRLGGELLVRLPSAEAYAPQVEKEQRWLPRLTPNLPIEIPSPVAMGEPAEGYPWRWSVYRWIEGEAATSASVALARDLGAFLKALQAIDVSDGPTAGAHSFFRGAPLAAYGDEAHAAIARLDDVLRKRAGALWEAASATTWTAPPVWVHGDIAPSNLLMRDGRLFAVIDFGCLAVGDPACDLAIAWTFFEGEGRDAFRQAVGQDDATWLRGKAWALWKAAILATGLAEGPARDVAAARAVLQRLLTDAG